MDASSFYNSWLVQPLHDAAQQAHTQQQPSDDFRQSTAGQGSTQTMDDIMADIAGPSTPSTAAQSFFLPPYSSGFYPSYPYSSSWPSQTATVPLSNYSSLNGATTSSTSQASPPRQPMVIDPALTNLNGSAHTPQRSFYQLPQQQSTSFFLPQFYPHQQQQQQQQQQQTQQQQQQQDQQQQATLSPQALHSPTVISAINPAAIYNPSQPSTVSAPSPQERKERLLQALRPLMDPKAFTGAHAVQTLVQHLEAYGPQEVEASTRLMILSNMRDHAPDHYFRAWTENQAAMDILRDWLKAGVTSKVVETIMPLLHIIDRLPLTVESLKVAKLGKLVLKLVKEPPSPAIKDMASKVERKWRRLLEGVKAPSTDMEDTEDLKSKKRKEPPTKPTLPTKKPAVGAQPKLSTTPPSQASSIKKKDPVPKPATPATKDVKSDSSFFSAPKPKPKLPTFKKAPPVKKEPDTNVAQPSSIDPFQEALRSMGKLRKDSPAPTPPPTASSSSTPPQHPGVASKSGKKKKSVTWASQDKLESIKLIDRAIYDDDPVDGVHVTHSLRDLDRGEGAALHAHLFEETVDWSEPLIVEIPPDIDVRPRGGDSEEKVTQENRELTALGALYMSPAHIPDTPGEASYSLSEADVDKDITQMVVGPEVDSIFWTDPPPSSSSSAAMNPTNLASVSELIAQLGSTPDMKIESSSALATLQALTPDQIQSLLREVSVITQGPQQGSVAQPLTQSNPSDIWAAQGPAYQLQPYDYSGYHVDDNNVDRSSWGVRGRGARGGAGGVHTGGGRGRGDGGFRQFRRKPCTFFQAGRCKYGDQCDFAHEIV